MGDRNYPLQTLPLPSPPTLRRMLGPSFILLGLGLGSGEIILWPYLVSNYGLGIAWGILVGITIQFFINMEVERYALIYGESIFVGFVRRFRYLPLWFIASTFLGFGWPGIGLSASHLLSSATGIDVRVVSTSLFLIIGLLLSVGRVLYHTVEFLQRNLILIGTPLILLITLYFARSVDWQALGAGLVGLGPGYFLLPTGISLATFLGALAYSGAGGNLNLSQSFYIRDKGYGMGKYADQIKSVFLDVAANSETRLAGATFPLTPGNLDHFKAWWRLTNIEHFLVFWGLGLATMLLLSVLAYVTVFGLGSNSGGINFVINEARVIGQRTWPVVGALFLVVTGLMLAATQLTVLDSTSRIITENYLLLKGRATAQISKAFYVILWTQVIFGAIVSVLAPSQPRQLLTLGAVINAFSMFFYIALILYLNNRVLPKVLRPSWLRNLVLVAAFVFFGVLCVAVVLA